MGAPRQEAEQDDGAVHTVVFGNPTREILDDLAHSEHEEKMVRRVSARPLFVAISDIPNFEAARVVRGIDLRGWKQDELTSPE